MLTAIRELKQGTKLVLHTSVLRIPHDGFAKILEICKSNNLRLQLPAAYFYEVFTLRRSELFGEKAKLFLDSIVKAGVELAEETIEDLYSEGSAHEQASEDRVYLVQDTLKLEEMIMFATAANSKQRILVPSEMLHNMDIISPGTSAWVVRTIEEVKPIWKGYEVIPYVKGEAQSGKKRTAKEFFSGSSYVKANKLLKETEEAKFFTIKEAGKGKYSASVMKIYRQTLGKEEEKERLRLLKEACGFFRNIQPIHNLLYQKGNSAIVSGIITETIHGQPLGSFLEKNGKDIPFENNMYESFLRTLLELNLCGIYYTNVNISKHFVNSSGKIVFSDFDSFQINHFAGEMTEGEYRHPAYKEGDIFYPIYQNYAIGVLLLQAISLYCDRLGAYRLFEHVFEKGHNVPLGNYIELLENEGQR